MPQGISTQLPVRVPPADVPDHACVRWQAAGFELELAGAREQVRWGRSLVASRRTGRWRRGRAGGQLVVDVVPVDPWRVLLTVHVEQPDRWWSVRLRPSQGREIAAALRDRLEGLRTDQTLEETSIEAALDDAPTPVAPNVTSDVSGILPA